MQLLLNEAIYRKIIVELLPQTRKFLWIVTADIKDLHELLLIASSMKILFPKPSKAVESLEHK